MLRKIQDEDGGWRGSILILSTLHPPSSSGKRPSASPFLPIDSQFTSFSEYTANLPLSSNVQLGVYCVNESILTTLEENQDLIINNAVCRTAPTIAV